MVETTGFAFFTRAWWTPSRQAQLLFFIAAVLIFAGIGLRSPWPADEPRFVEVAREMVDNGQWLFPTRAGEYYPDKPPVFMWSIAGFYEVLGNLKVAFLLPSALSGMLMLWLVYDLGRRLWNPRTALQAVFLLLVTPQFISEAKDCQIDAMVSCMITLGCYGLMRHFFLGPDWKWYFLGWAAMGLGIITKGVGFLPLLMLIPLAVVTRRVPGAMASRWRWIGWAGPLAMLAVVATWLVPMVLTVNHINTPALQEYKQNILFHQTAHRYAHAWHHLHPWYYFLVAVIPLMWFPLPLLMLAKWRELKQQFLADPRVFVLLCWVVLVIVFFSLSPGKRGVYILPALPMLCLALAVVWQGTVKARWFNAGLAIALWVVVALLTVFALMVLTDQPAVQKVVREYQGIAHPLAALMLGGIAAAAVLLVLLRRQDIMLRFGAITALVWLLISFAAYPLMEDYRTPRVVLAKTRQAIGADGELALVQLKEQFILFSPIDITHFGYLPSVGEQERNAWLWQQERPRRFILIPSGEKLQCYDLGKAEDMGTVFRKHWLLLPSSARRADCPAPEHKQRFLNHAPGRWQVQ